MRTTPSVPAFPPVASALREASHHGRALVPALRLFVHNGATALRRLRAERRRRRERIRTEAMIASLPREIRSDIGWRTRSYAECDDDR